jgi:hypothetical protein
LTSQKQRGGDYFGIIAAEVNLRIWGGMRGGMKGMGKRKNENFLSYFVEIRQKDKKMKIHI